MLKVCWLTHTSELFEQIRLIIANKRRTRAHYRCSRLPSYKRVSENLANPLKTFFAKHKNKCRENFLTKMSPKNEILRLVTKKALQYQVLVILNMKPDGGIASSEIDQAKLFKNHLAENLTARLNVQISKPTDLVKSLIITWL